jgi:hypothetical protein
MFIEIVLSNVSICFENTYAVYLAYKNICDNVKKDGCLTLFFEFAILKDMVYSSLASLYDNFLFQIKDTNEKNHQISTGSMDLHRMHQESMKFLAENASL